MFGLVHIITYIRLPTVKAYDTFIISAFSIFIFGLCFLNNLQFAESVDSNGFAFAMLNLWSTFVTHFSYDSHNIFLVQSRTMCIPKICFVGTMSFIENGVLKAFFSIRIFTWSRPTIRISSTCSRRIGQSPPSNFFTNT